MMRIHCPKRFVPAGVERQLLGSVWTCGPQKLHLQHIGGPAWTHSGNAGVLDLVAELHWVRDNIETFGGDPGNVTIFGESGGGGKVSVLFAMPAARGLFHRAIIQSGAAIRVSTRERASALAEAVLNQLGFGPTNASACKPCLHNTCSRRWRQHRAP